MSLDQELGQTSAGNRPGRPAAAGPLSQTTEYKDGAPGKGRPVALRELAGQGLLARVAAACPERRAALESQLYALTWPVVFHRLTKEMELGRGHFVCARSVRALAPECFDRFQDDVAAVVAYALRYANLPIRDLEGWLASRLTAATVDGHRRDRGLRGAVQRPRLPKWLAERLGEDRWLNELALAVLTWVGVPAAAGNGLWPLDAWRLRRAEVRGDWTADAGALERDLETVLAAMRTREPWYQRFVERPLGAKQAPVYAGGPPEGESLDQTAALALVAPHESEEARLGLLAQLAVDELARRLAAGEDPRACVMDVVRRVFAEADPAWGLDLAPHAGADPEERVSALLADPAEVDRVVAAVLDIAALVAVR